MGSNILLSSWTEDQAAFNDTSRRNVYLSVYGALGVGQGEAATETAWSWWVRLYAARLPSPRGCVIYYGLLRRIQSEMCCPSCVVAC